MPLPTSVHVPTAIGNERNFHIVKRGDQWCLLAKSTGKTLGCHDTKEGAEAQERAVQANKHNIDQITVEEMRIICPSCADKMVAHRMKAVKLDFNEKNFGLSEAALEGLCSHFGDAEGFRTRCMDSKGLGEGISDLGAFCNWLKGECFGTTKESDKTEVKEHTTAETHNIRGVEIFAVGTWNEDKYTSKDLDGLVETFNATKEYLKPYLKIGHSEDQQLLAGDSLPAAGWISKIYRKGDKLLADIQDIPAKVFDLIKAKAYARISSEIFVNVKVKGKTYPYALKAVALLGGETPAVQTLEDIHALYELESAVLAYGKEAEVRKYESGPANYSEEDTTMTEERDHLGQPSPTQIAVSRGAAPVVPHAGPPALAPSAPAPHMEPDGDECYKMLKIAHDELEGLKKQMGQHACQMKESAAKIQVLESEKQALSQEKESLCKELSDSKAELEKVFAEGRKKEVKDQVATLITTKKILPAQAPLLEEILLSAKQGEVKKFKVSDKEFASAEALILEFVGQADVSLTTTPATEQGRSVGVSTEDGDSMDTAVKDFMKRTGEKSYRTAYIAVAKELEKIEPKKA